MRNKKFIFFSFCLLLLFSGCKKGCEDKAVWQKVHEIESPFSSNILWNICVAPNDNVYISYTDGDNGGSYGYIYYDKEKWSYHVVENEFMGSAPDWELTDDGSVWMTGFNKLYHLNSGSIIDSFEVSGYDTTNSFNRFSQIEIINNEIWLLHRTWGLYKFESSGSVLIHYPNGLSVSDYTRLETDIYSNKWVSTNYHPNRILKFTTNSEWINLDNDNPLLEQCSGCIPEPQYYYLSNLAINPFGKINFLGSSGNGASTHLFNLENDIIMEDANGQFDPPSNFGSCRFDKQGNLWLWRTSGIQEAYLARFDNGSLHTIDASDADVSGNVVLYALDFDSKNNLWLVTNKGILVYNETDVDL